jgi:uncharacterized protein YjaZ
MIHEAYEKCLKIISPKIKLKVYLFIGFFSPDAFVMNFNEKPVICFGLERFRDFSLFKILFAHEYAHFLLNVDQNELPKRDKMKWRLISEGIATHFSCLVFPKRALSDHFLSRRDTLNWCLTNEKKLKAIYCSDKFSDKELETIYFKGNQELNIPPRAGKYLGFQSVKKYLSGKESRAIKALLVDKDLALSLKL